MVCQMELTSHLLTAAAFGTMKNSENELAGQLIEQTGDNTLTLMDKGYYSLGLLNAWSQAGKHRHWMIPSERERSTKRSENWAKAIIWSR